MLYLLSTFHLSLFAARCDVKLIKFETKKQCQKQRSKEVFLAKVWYRITDGSDDRDADFPIPEIPWLDQGLNKTRLFYALDDFEASYMAKLLTWVKISGEIETQLIAGFTNLPYASDREFIGMFMKYTAALKMIPVINLL